MSRPLLATALVIACLGLATLQAVAQPPRPGIEGNGLTENESATLWSRDDDTGYIGTDAYEAAYNESRGAVQQVGNATDITFTSPPATAATWTRNDFADYQAGAVTESVYPPHADRRNGSYLRDVHATMFAVTPATVTHQTPNGTRRYVAPNGTLRAVIDYRVAVPPPDRGDNRTTTYALLDHEIESVALWADGERLTRRSGAHRLTIPYQLPAETRSLRLVANVSVALQQTTTVRAAVTDELANGTTTTRIRRSVRETRRTNHVVVRDQLSVVPYDPAPRVAYARYPDGDLGVLAYHDQPWQGLTLTATGSHRVRGIWRFYTARDPRWDSLVHATDTGTTRRDSDVLPVAVHAYPSRLGPRAEPTGSGPDLLQVWGREQPSPAATLPDTVHVEVVDQPYEASYGIAVRTATGRPETATVRGIVRGVEIPVEPDRRPRQVRASRLTVRTLTETADGARLLVRLEDATTGAPIALGATATARFEPLTDTRDGYIALAGERIQTNSSGLATVTVSEPGVYTAWYRPGSWLGNDPAYTSDGAIARYHPLATIAGWIDLLTTALLWALPFLFVLYLGRQLGRLLTPRYPN